MSVLLLADTWMATYAATLTATSALAGYPATRVADGHRDRRWKAATSAAQRVRIDRGTGNLAAPTAWAVFGQAGVSASITLQSSPDGASWTNVDAATGTPVGDVFRVVTGAAARRYWGATFGNNVAAPEAGEVLIGALLTLPNPSIHRVEEIPEGKVARFESETGHPWKHKSGEERMRLIYGWDGLPVSTLTLVRAAWRAAAQGARNVGVQDVAGVARYMEWLRFRLPSRSTDYREPSVDIELEFLEVL